MSDGRFLVSLLLFWLAAMGAGVGIGYLIWAHHEPTPIIIQVPTPMPLK